MNQILEVPVGNLRPKKLFIVPQKDLLRSAFRPWKKRLKRLANKKSKK